VDCQELTEFRSASTHLWSWLIYYYPSSTEKEILDGDPQPRRHAVCEALRKETDASVKDVPDIVAKSARELKVKLTTDVPKYLGGTI